MYGNTNERAIQTNDFGKKTADFIDKFSNAGNDGATGINSTTSSMSNGRMGNAYQSPKNMSSEDVIAKEDRKKVANTNVMSLFNKMNEEKNAIDEQQTLDRQSRMANTSISFYTHGTSEDNEDLSNEYSYYSRVNELGALIIEKNISDGVQTPAGNVEDVIWDYIERKDSQDVYDAIKDYLNNPSADKQSDLENASIYEKTLEDRIAQAFDEVKNFAGRVINKAGYGMELLGQGLDGLYHDRTIGNIDFANWVGLIGDEKADALRTFENDWYAMSSAVRSYDRFGGVWTDNDWERVKEQLKENPDTLNQYVEDSNVLNNLVKTGFGGLFSYFQAISLPANMVAGAISVATEIPVVEKLMSLGFVELPKTIINTGLSYIKPLYKLWNTLDNESKSVISGYIMGKYSMEALKWAAGAKTTQELVEDIKGTFDTAFKDAWNWLKFKKGEKISDKTSEQKTSMKQGLTEGDKVKAKRTLLEKILGKTITKNLNDNTANKLMRSLDDVENRSDKDIEKLIEEKETQKQSKIDSENKLLNMDKKSYKQSDILEATKTDNMPNGYDFVGNLLKGLKEIYQKMTPETDVINGEEYPYITDDIKFVDDMITKYAEKGLSRADINTILRKTSNAVDTYNNKIGAKNGTPLESEAALESLRELGKKFVNNGLDEYLPGTENAFKTLDMGISDDMTLIDHLNKRQGELRGEYAGQKYQGNPKKITTKIKQQIRKLRPFKSSSKLGFGIKIFEELADLGDLDIITLNKTLSKIGEAYKSMNEGTPSKVNSIQKRIDDIINATNKMLDSAQTTSEQMIDALKNNPNIEQGLFDEFKKQYTEQFADLLKEGGATETEINEAKIFIQETLFDM